PDRATFPGLELGFEVMRRGGTAGAALNAANEAAGARFLAGAIGFLDIARACRAAVDSHTFDPRPPLATLWGVDAWARPAGAGGRLRVGTPECGVRNRQGGPGPGFRDLHPRARPFPPGQVERREGGEVLHRLRPDDPRLPPGRDRVRAGRHPAGGIREDARR